LGLFLAPDAEGRLPVSLITGYLGSGKTTLVNALLRHSGMDGTAVVINEFGEVALDQHFVEKSDGEVVVMANGCLCCTLQGDLEGVVGTLFAKSAAGEVPEFRRLLVETTGLADPAPIMQLLLGSPLLGRSVRLDTVVATIDAVHGLATLDAEDEAVKQAALADRLVVTKTDLAPTADTERLRARLAALNPGAAMFDAVQGAIAPERLFGAGLADRGVRDPRGWLGPVADGHHHAHGDEVEAFCLAADAALDWRALSRFLTRLRVREAERLLRVKGLVNVAGEDGPVAIHGVHHVFHPPVRLARWPDEDRRTRIVIIGRGLDRARVEADWRAFLAG
jgi:G3E family GTPase